MEILNSAIYLFIQILFYNVDDCSADVFLHCVPRVKFSKNEGKWWFGIEKVWKMFFENVWKP